MLGDDNDRVQSKQESIKCLEKLSWYAGELSREEAEDLLFTVDEKGTYLIRKSPRNEEYAVSARTSGTIKHFIVNCDQSLKYTFGPEQFSSLSEMLNFFDLRPTIKYDGGKKELTLEHPFCGKKHNNNDTLIKEPALQIENSKEGYLHKRGVFIKNWKERWFTVHDDVMKYFKKQNDEKPIRQMKLSDATAVSECYIDEKHNCFCMVFPQRTFYFYGKSAEDKTRWLTFLQGRIDGLRLKKEG